MKLLGSLDIKSINNVGLRVNEGLNTQTLLGNEQLTKYAKKNQYYYTQVDRNVTLPDAALLPTGWTISVFSNKISEGTIHLLDAAGNEQYKVKPKKSVTITLLENTTAAGTWKVIESGTGVGLRNVVITSNEESIFSIEAGTVSVNPFIATVSNGFEEDGTAIEEIIDFSEPTALSLPAEFPTTKYIYLTVEGLLVDEISKQCGGNIFPTNAKDGDIFFNKPLRKNFKYENGTWNPYPCVAVGEVTWSADNAAVATAYPYNEWWWEDTYGDVRNTVIISTGNVLTASNGTASVGNFIATIADGFDALGHPIDYVVSLPITKTATYTAGTPAYLYVDKTGNILVENSQQDGGDTLPTENFTAGNIFYSKKDGRNYKAVDVSGTPTWVEYPCTAVGEISDKDVVSIYTFNDWWWQYYDISDLIAHSFFYQDDTKDTTQITLDREAPDKSLVTVNVGNTVLLSDTYDIGSDKKTLSFISPIAAGTPIEVRWYIPLATVGQEVTGGANQDLSNLTTIGNQKILPMGGNVGDIVVRSTEGAKWAPPTGITIGTVFMSDLKYPIVPEGALEYNGTEVTDADTTYPEFWKSWLLADKMYTGSYAEYEEALTANNGTCPFFAIDAENKKFKTPTWSNGVFAAAATTQEEINKYYKDQFQGHHHKYNYAPSTHKFVDGNLDEISNTPTAVKTDRVGDAITDGVNGEPRTGSETFPKHVRKRWFVQVANAVELTSYHNIDDALASKVNKAGDTMTGNLEFTGDSGIVLTTGDSNSYIIHKAGNNLDITTNTGKGIFLNSADNFKPYYSDTTNAYALAYGDIAYNIAPDYSSPVTITNNVAYTAPANGWIMGYSGTNDYAATSLVVGDAAFLSTGRKSYNTSTSICFFIGKGQTVTPRADAILRFIPCIGA